MPDEPKSLDGDDEEFLPDVDRDFGVKDDALFDAVVLVAVPAGIGLIFGSRLICDAPLQCIRLVVLVLLMIKLTLV
jgi:hypothetical protein